MSATMLATFSLAVLLHLTPANAQPVAKATIPFDFSIGETKLTAGAYLIRSPIPGTVQLVRDDFRSSAEFITIGVHAPKVPAQSSLVFNRYGDSYFLSQYWSRGTPVGRQLQLSRPEREAAIGGNSPKARASAATAIRVNVALGTAR